MRLSDFREVPKILCKMGHINVVKRGRSLQHGAAYINEDENVLHHICQLKMFVWVILAVDQIANQCGKLEKFLKKV